MTKAEIIRLIVCKVKDYRFTHDEMLKMSKEEILKYYPQLGRGWCNNRFIFARCKRFEDYKRK